MNTKKMLVGVVGNICAGKSFIARYFEQMLPGEVYTIDTDDITKSVYSDKNNKWFKQLYHIFGDACLDENGNISKQYVKDNPQYLYIFYDTIAAAFMEELHDKMNDKTYKMIIVSSVFIPNLVNSREFEYKFDYIVGIYVSYKTIFERIASRDPDRSIKEVEMLLERQPSMDDIANVSDIVISNDGPVDLLYASMKIVYRELLRIMNTK